MSILQMWRLRPTDGKSGHPPFRPIRHRLPSRWPVFHLAVQTRYSPSNKRILFFTIPFAPAKIEYFSDFFRKIAYIKVLYHLCTPIYGDIEYLCGLMCRACSGKYYVSALYEIVLHSQDGRTNGPGPIRDIRARNSPTDSAVRSAP